MYILMMIYIIIYYNIDNNLNLYINTIENYQDGEEDRDIKLENIDVGIQLFIHFRCLSHTSSIIYTIDINK